MTQEDKQLLIKDLCARLPYGVKIDVSRVEEWKELTFTPFILSNYYDEIEKLKPYLRPMSSMTKEEELDFILKCDSILKMTEKNHTCILSIDEIDWLLAHHFDYRGLIEKGLALEAPEDMYDRQI